MVATKLNNWLLVIMRVCFDLIFLNVAIFGGFYLRVEVLPLDLLSDGSPYAYDRFAAVANVAFIVSGFLSGWFYVSLSSSLGHDKKRVASVCFGLTLGLSLFLLPPFREGVPRSLSIIVPICFFVILILSRLIATRAKEYLGLLHDPDMDCWVRGSVLIVGTSSELRDCARFLRRCSVAVCCFTSSRGTAGAADLVLKYIDGIPLRPLEFMREAIRSGQIKSVICREADLENYSSFIDECLDHNVAIVRPGSVKGSWPFKEIMDLGVDDLFPARPRFRIDNELLSDLATNYRGKTVLVTGGGGSIGGALVAILARLQPASLLILDNSEYNLYNIRRVLAESGIAASASLVYGSVTDEEIVRSIFSCHSVDIVFHAAALKHVSIVDANPEAGVAVNTVGTELVARCAAESGVSRFVFVSTDKAVKPTTVMGGTKRQAELRLLHIAESTDMKISVVRFGNVAESSGSVIPAFKESVMHGRALQITSPTVRRYFMSLEEAASLVVSTVLDTDASVSGGNVPVYILDMGEPVVIDRLAKRLINFAGLRWDDHIHINYAELRFGDKESEELESARERLQTTAFPKIKRATLTTSPEEAEALSRLLALGSKDLNGGIC